MNDKTKRPDTFVEEPPAQPPEGAEAFMLNVNRALSAPLTLMMASIHNLGRVCLDDGAYPDTGTRRAAARELARLNQVYCRLLRLSCNLRDIARFRRGEEVIEPRWIDFSALCGRACEQAARAAGDGSVEFRPTSGAPILLNGDADQLERAVYNLLTNALLFRAGDETVLCTLSAADGRAWLRVSGGQGIPAHALERLYDAYDRAPDLRDSPEAGLSLGLPLCKHIAERHGGVLLPSSGEFATVVLSLPLGDPDPDEMPLGQPRGGYTSFPVDLVELSCLPLGSRLYEMALEED